jgi:hypothetical protein
MLICFVIRLGIVKGEETNHILESKGVEKKMREREKEKKESRRLHVMENYVTSATKKDRDAETILGH